ncbi:TPA: DUF4355 domain-containing protein [Streptococcus suis]|uniref:DUF4355 domain-containing protein n=1 Tax=Streptococcus suis TaxID=1307 RepID=UPI000942E2A8|nr:DUF4355 domain-containing protein [Streptococcus suis]QBX30771.1 capsid and scaffold protein [Streptococcus phage Javan570]MDS1159955.1 DUF4355 domain-containing protein [Streptococcus suis]RRN54638.1 DUF4355 domain-containing protein [Streptococcus suis]HEL1563228.1 DUF4355 domain-containing protein [Streptococcus suis]HEL1686049.1 DUF4355 domain-containing protein [Streptococcus suis]
MSEESKEEVSTETEQVDTQESVDTKQERTFTRSDLSKMIAAERAKWEAEQAKALENAKSEGERLAKLSKDERAKEEEQKRLDAIAERERAIAEKEMRIATLEILQDEGLPTEFLDVVLADSADQVKSNISNLRTIFDAEVEKRVDARLTQHKPRQGNTQGGYTKAEIMAISDTEKRQQLIAENKHLFTRGG